MNSEVKPEMAVAPKKLLDRVRDSIRVRHYSIRTEGAHVEGTRSYISRISVHSRSLAVAFAANGDVFGWDAKHDTRDGCGPRQLVA